MRDLRSVQLIYRLDPVWSSQLPDLPRERGHLQGCQVQGVQAGVCDVLCPCLRSDVYVLRWLQAEHPRRGEGSGSAPSHLGLSGQIPQHQGVPCSQAEVKGLWLPLGKRVQAEGVFEALLSIFCAPSRSNAWHVKRLLRILHVGSPVFPWLSILASDSVLSDPSPSMGSKLKSRVLNIN